jgi:hypothetical protein
LPLVLKSNGDAECAQRVWCAARFTILHTLLQFSIPAVG